MNAPPADHAIPVISPRLLKWFKWYARRYLRRHFNAVRILRDALPPEGTDSPSVIFLNHASWWDPLVALHLAASFFPKHRSFAPMDAEALKKYGMLRRLGFFPVERGSMAGARRFLRQSGSILAEPRHVLWLTPQGKFTDVRERPVRFEPGLGHLASRLPGVRFIPVALEYTWWLERSPEALAAFGTPVSLPAGLSASQCQELLENALSGLQDRLAAATLARRPEDFTTLLSGKAGVGGFYDWWRRMRSRARGAGFDPRHAGPPD